MTLRFFIGAHSSGLAETVGARGGGNSGAWLRENHSVSLTIQVIAVSHKRAGFCRMAGTRVRNEQNKITQDYDIHENGGWAQSQGEARRMSRRVIAQPNGYTNLEVSLGGASSRRVHGFPSQRRHLITCILKQGRVHRADDTSWQALDKVVHCRG